MNFVAIFIAGALLCNAIPHLTSGLSGHPFPTPFAKPSGVGASPPLVNFLWGVLNAVAGSLILSRYPVTAGLNPACAAFVAGVLMLGAFTSIHFGKVHRGAAGR